MTNAGGTERPLFRTNSINGKPVVRFDGVANKLINMANIGIPQPFTIFAVGKKTGTSGEDCRFFNGNAPDAVGANGTMVSCGGGGHFYIYAGGTPPEDPSADLTSVFHIFTGVIAGGNANGYIDGILKLNAVAVGSNPVGGNCSVMSEIVSGTCYKGDVAEILVYNSALSNANRMAVEGYLMNKYAAYNETGDT
jgi:hypothetical protein